MLPRTKSHRNRKSGGRYSDGDSSATETPVFASVHRPRHTGISAIKRDGASKVGAVSNAAAATNAPIVQQRQSYQQYQQQRRLQQQQQQHQQQQQQQQQLENASNSHAAQKFAKTKNNWYEQQQQQQQLHQQLPLHQQQHLGEELGAAAATKQSIAVAIPQPPAAANALRAGHQINTNAQHQQQQQQQQHQQQQQQQRQQHQQPYSYDAANAKMSRIPVQQPHQLQQQQQQQQPHPQQQQQPHNFNHISKTATNLLNDIYEKHLLSQTTFHDSEQQQQQHQQHQRFVHGRADYLAATHNRQQQHQLPQHFPPNGQQQTHVAATFVPIHGGKQHPQHKPLHFLKLPPPPPPPHCLEQATASSSSAYAYQQHFQFSDAYVEPVNSRPHFLRESQPSPPPPPPAPLNHVYETIKERPPLPPPKHNHSSEAPPLPPSRQLKKRLLTAAAAATGTNGRSAAKLSGKRGTMTTTTTTLAAEPHQLPATGELTKKQPHVKLAPAQPPAYVAPPTAARQQQQQQQQQYNPQQRTKADGEQKSYIYQQLRERQQQQQQQQQQTHAVKAQQQASSAFHDSSLQQSQQQQKHNQCSVREHPLGAATAGHDTKAHSTTTATAATKATSDVGSSSSNNKNNNNKHNTPSAAATTATTATATTTKAVVHFAATAKPPPPAHSVEYTLQQAGLLPTVSATVGANIGAAHNNNNKHNNANGQHHNNRPSALPIVFEEDSGEFQDVLVLEEDGTAKLPYRHGKIEVRLETAQAMAAAAYYARAAQKLAQSGSTRSRTAELPNTTARNGGYCGALQRAPPPMPPGLARRLANKENYGLGKVKVMLRVSDTHSDADNPHFMAVDKKKRQVTLTDPAAASSVAASTSQERGPMVAAPKMFAFDSLFTADDQQSDICASALSEVIPAVLEGSDGCLLTIGYPSSGQSRTMLGGVNPPSDLGAIPSAISWLYKGINERRQKSGARFSVRVSALGVSATKPDSSSKDLLAAHATESDDSPGVYLRDDFLGGPTELRAPTAERAALFLDAALAGRPQGGLEPAMIFTLHVYQYSLSRKGGVAGGRSRLHLIDLGGCANRNGGLPLSGIGNILLAILSGQRHPPNKDHPLTPLLKDCLAPLTCHVAIMAHVTHTQSHTDALTTIQLASRIHRMRRRKHRFPMPSEKTGVGGLAGGMNGGHQSTGSSAGSGADPSSSELSADTVIYMGPSDDATDGEHPPVYLPSLSSGDNRGVMSKALKGSGLEKQPPQTKNPTTPVKKAAAQKAPQSPVTTSRTGSLKRGHANSPTPPQQQQQHQHQPQQQQQPQLQHQPAPAAPSNEPQFYSPVHSLKTLPHSASSPKIVAGSLRHPMAIMCSKGSNVPSPKGSPLRRPGVGAGVATAATAEPLECPGSPMRKITEEQWIDGPRVSRAKVAEARHLLREVNHVKQCETWIDGPKSQSTRSLTIGNLPTTPSQVQGYGFMDSHKKSMIRQWVENQTSQVFQTTSAASSPTHGHHRDQQAQHLRNITYHMSQLKQKSLDAPEDLYATSTRQQPHPLAQQQQLPPQLQQQHSLPNADQHSLRSSQLELVHPLSAGLASAISTTNASAPAEIRGAAHYQHGAIPPHTAAYNETDLHSTHSLHAHVGYGSIAAAAQLHQLPATSASDSGGHHCDRQADCDEDQDSGPSEVPPALPLIEPLGSREISHESLHRILSRHVSRESLYQQQQQLELRRHDELTHTPSRHSSHNFSQHSMGMSDCGLQVTEEEIARTMGSEHPLAALSQVDNMSIVSSFNMAGDAFSDCAMGERTRNQFDQLARLREIFTSQLAMAEVTPVFRSGCDVGSVYSEPAYRFNTGPGSVCSEPAYRPPSPRLPSRSPSQGSLPSLNGIMQIAGMEQYASLRHPDGASDPNLPKIEKAFVMEHEDICEVDEKSALLSPSKRPSLDKDHLTTAAPTLPAAAQNQLPLLPLNTSSEAYDSGHDSSTPRTSKHSGISRRAESGYHSVATARDSDESSFTSGLSKEHHNRITLQAKVKKRPDKGLCNWLMNPFTCTYPETEGEISDF